MVKATLNVSIDFVIANKVEILTKRQGRNKSLMVEVLLKEALQARENKEEGNNLTICEVCGCNYAKIIGDCPNCKSLKKEKATNPIG